MVISLRVQRKRQLKTDGNMETYMRKKPIKYCYKRLSYYYKFSSSKMPGLDNSSHIMRKTVILSRNRKNAPSKDMGHFYNNKVQKAMVLSYIWRLYL